MTNIDKKVKEYEHFLENILKKDLKEIENKLLQSSQKYEEWESLQSTIRTWEELQDKDLNMLIPLGCKVNVNASTESYDKLLVDIGIGCLLEMNFEEARKYSDIRKKVLKKELHHYRQLAVQVKVKIKLVLLAINELMAA